MNEKTIKTVLGPKGYHTVSSKNRNTPYHDTVVVKVHACSKILGVVVFVDRQGLTQLFAVFIRSVLKVVRQAPRQENARERTIHIRGLICCGVHGRWKEKSMRLVNFKVSKGYCRVFIMLKHSGIFSRMRHTKQL